MPNAAKPSLGEALENFHGLHELTPDLEDALEAVEAQPQELRALPPRLLARAALAAASAKTVCGTVLTTIASHIPKADLHQFEPGDLAMLAWAFAAADLRDQEAMSALGSQVADRAWEFSTEELAKIVCAFAELHMLHQAMMATVCMEVMWKIDQFSARSLAQIVEACVRLGQCKAPMFDWVAARVTARVQDYGPEDLSKILWAFGEACVKSEVLSDAVSSQIAKPSCKELTDDELSRLAWAFGKMNVAPHGVMHPLYHQRLVSRSETTQ
jgi:hypothetical protein